MMYSEPVKYRGLTTEYNTTLCSPHPTKVEKLHIIRPVSAPKAETI